MITREEVLDKAKACVCHDRNEQYGEPEDNFKLIARLWSIYTDTPLTARDVAAMMVLFKTARLMGGKKEDNWIDICGYAACGAECDK